MLANNGRKLKHMCANDLHLTEQSIPAEPSCETYNGNK